MSSEIRVNKIANRAGLSTVEYTDTGIIVSGIVTCTEISGLNALNIAGVSTFASPLDINGDIDVDGHTNLDNLSVAGVSTFSGEICLDTHPTRIKSSAGDLEIGVGTTSSFFITGGPYSAERLETTVDCVILYSAGSKVARTHNGRFEVGNPAAAIGIGATLSITGGANFAGIVTASAFKLPDGSDAGADLTSVDSNIVPDNDSSRELGQETKAWQRLWSDEVRILGNGRVQFVGAYMGMVSANGHLLIKNNESKEIQLHSKFGSGILIAENTGHLMPTTDSAINIGSNTIRFQNVYADTYYGDGANLTNLPAGAPVGGASTNTVFFENDKAVAVNYQVTSTKNAMSAGPIAINAGIAVTVPSGCSWTIV
jgi:hypothetical protein